MSVRVALVGCGRWGERLLRALSAAERATVVAVADVDRGRLARARALAPRARLARTLDEALDARVDAVVIATPPSSHAELALRALDAGADVFVEKPLALTSAQADRCAARAAALGRVGMVGHLLRYHPSVVRLVALAREGHLGDVVSFSAARFSTGGGGASSALWTLGPHDLSVLSALDPSPLREACVHVAPGGERIALTARLESGLAAHIELWRSSPTKERRIRIDGTLRAALFDDVSAPDRLLLVGARGDEAASGEVAPAHELAVPFREPLAVEIEHFLRCVEKRAQPLTPLDEGAAIVRILERADAMLAAREPSEAQVQAAQAAAAG